LFIMFPNFTYFITNSYKEIIQRDFQESVSILRIWFLYINLCLAEEKKRKRETFTNNAGHLVYL